MNARYKKTACLKNNDKDETSLSVVIYACGRNNTK